MAGQGIMVPFSERRHRIQGLEVPAVAGAVWRRLDELVAGKENPDEAEILFRVLYRLTIHRPGQPNYGLFTWKRARELLEASRKEWYHT